MEKHFGCVRFVYNWALNKNIESYQTDKKHLSRFTLSNILTIKKKEEEFKFLEEVGAQSLQIALESLDRAYTRFFKEKKGFPKFKSKKHNKNSFSFHQSTKVDFKSGTLQITKFKSIKCVFDRTFEGSIKKSTISKTPSGKYFISILVKTNNVEPNKKPINENQIIGIDLGIKMFATLSDGTTIENPKHLKKSLDKLKKLSRKHSKKVKGSKNREKSRIKLARLHEKVANQRRDFLHKASTMLVKSYNTIALETLRVDDMLRQKKFSLSIADLGLSTFNQFLDYKSSWYGTNILRIGRFEPSSKTCSNCGNVKKDLELSDRTYNCQCGHTENRDLNAAKVIKNIALTSLRKGIPNVKSVESKQ